MIKLFIILISAVFLINKPVYAQDSYYFDDVNFDVDDSIIDDDFGIEDPIINNYSKNNKEDSRTVSKSILKSFSGEVRYSHIFSGGGTRTYGVASLRFDHNFGRLRTVVEGLGETIDIELKQKLNTSYCGNGNNDCTGLAEERTISYRETQGRLEEGYFAYDLSSFMTVSAGKKKVIWGQFEPFSPLNFSFPMNMLSTGVKFSKLKSTLGQNFVGLDLYPTSFMSLEGYFFPDVTIDDVARQRIEDGQTNNNQPILNGSENNVTGIGSAKSYGVIPDGKKGRQYGAKAMFYPSWGTFGFSYFKGYDTLWTLDFKNIAPLKKADGTDFTFASGGSNFLGLSDGDKYYFDQTTPGLGKQKMIGFEIAIPYKKVTFKAELASYDKFMEIDDYDSSVFSHVLNGQSSGPSGYNGNYADAQEFVNWVQNNNGGNLYIPFRQNIGAIGFDADLEKWMINLAIFFIQEDISGEHQRIIDLQETAFPNNIDDGDDQFVFPMLNITRYHNSRKSVMTGLAGGVIGNGVGIALYHSREFKESLTIGVALQTIEYFSNDQIEDANGGGIVYERENDSVSGIAVSIGYKF